MRVYARDGNELHFSFYRYTLTWIRSSRQKIVRNTDARWWQIARAGKYRAKKNTNENDVRYSGKSYNTERNAECLEM